MHEGRDSYLWVICALRWENKLIYKAYFFFKTNFSIKKMKAMLISIVSPPEMIANKQIIQADLSILRKAKK